MTEHAAEVPAWRHDAALCDLLVIKALAWSRAINTPHELEARVGLLLATRALEVHRS